MYENVSKYSKQQKFQNKLNMPANSKNTNYDLEKTKKSFYLFPRNSHRKLEIVKISVKILENSENCIKLCCDAVWLAPRVSIRITQKAPKGYSASKKSGPLSFAYLECLQLAHLTFIAPKYFCFNTFRRVLMLKCARFEAH